MCPPAISDNQLSAALEGLYIPPKIDSLSLLDIPNVNVRLLTVYKASGVRCLGDFLRLGSIGRFKLRQYGNKSEEFLAALLLDCLKNVGIPEERHEPSVPDAPQSIWIPSYDDLKDFDNPCSYVTEMIWDLWKEKLAFKSNYLISDIASHLDLEWPDTCATLTIGYFLELSYSEFFRLKSFGQKRKRTTILCLAFSIEFDVHSQLTSITDLLNAPVISRLDERERFILGKRLTAPESAQWTLEQLGQDLHVTRERCRQMEKEILRKIRDSFAGQQAIELLASSKEDIFLRLSSGELYIEKRRLNVLSKQLSGPILLTIYLQGRSVYSWLDENFLQFEDAWFYSDGAAWQTIFNRLAHWRSEQLPLPEHVIGGSSNCTVREVRAYFHCTSKGISYEGYILASSSIQSKRCARLHAFISSESLNGAEIHKLAAYYAECGEQLGANPFRTVYSAIAAAESMFIASPVTVYTLHQGAPWRPSMIEQVEESTFSSNSNIESSILAFVTQNGPCTVSSIVDHLQTDSKLNVSAGSITPIISQSSKFYRLAPGIYDSTHHRNNAERTQRARKFLANETDIRRYSFAKHAGEDPHKIFPAWDKEQETYWLTHCEHIISHDAWQSFLSTIDIESVPNLTDSTKQRLIIQQRSSRWSFKVSWQDEMPTSVPSVREVLLICLHARRMGHISWIGANHALGTTQIAERTGMNAIILGIMLGLLAPTGEDAWRQQSPSTYFDKQWIRFENLLLADSQISWNNPEVRQMLQAFIENPSRTNWLELRTASLYRDIAINGSSAVYRFEIPKPIIDEVQLAAEDDDELYI